MTKWERIRSFLQTKAREQEEIWYMGTISEEQLAFVKNYLQVRAKENRIYEGEIITTLPSPSPETPNYDEWEIRNSSARQFRSYLERKVVTHHYQELTVLDIGCGNGWFGNFLTEIPEIRYVGVEINELELKQVKHLPTSEKMEFILGDIFSQSILPENSIDIVTLNSSFQYFPDLDLLLEKIKKYTVEDAELDILDTKFYSLNEVQDAEKRSIRYYRNLDAGELINSYHHHSLEELEPFNAKIMYNPNSLFNRFLSIFTTINPFHWVKIEL